MKTLIQEQTFLKWDLWRQKMEVQNNARKDFEMCPKWEDGEW